MDLDLARRPVAVRCARESRPIERPRNRLRGHERHDWGQSRQAAGNPGPLQSCSDPGCALGGQLLDRDGAELSLPIVFAGPRQLSHVVQAERYRVRTAAGASRGQLCAESARVYVWFRPRHRRRQPKGGHVDACRQSVLLEWFHFNAVPREWWNAALRALGAQAVLAAHTQLRSTIEPNDLHAERCQRRSRYRYSPARRPGNPTRRRR